VRRQICAGARIDRIALLDNFCWPDPVRSEGTPDGAYKCAQLVRACRGLYDATQAYGTPLVSGKDSMKNDSVMEGIKISVPPTLLVSAIGVIDDVRDSMTLEPERAGDHVYLLGTTRDETGGSEYFRYLGEREGVDTPLGVPAAFVGNKVPRLDTSETVPLYSAVRKAHEAGLIRSAATPAMGGWGVCMARTAMAGRLGLDLDVSSCDDLMELSPNVALFSESLGRFLVTVRAEDAERFGAAMAGRPCRHVGQVTDDARVVVRGGESTWLDVDVPSLVTAFKETLADE
jgi:phosphoribosylformylglycinamidine synthase